MDAWIRGRRFAAIALLAALAAVAVSACGSSGSSGDAATLLNQTFSGAHKINSGNLSLTLTINPSGSQTLRGPLTVSFGGPFQSRGAGKVPQSNFSISFNALGRSGSLGLVSTGTAGYVTLQGTSYQLPAATFQKLESSFSQAGSSSGQSTLNRLGIQPLQWLQNPKIVGDETVGGADTTHIRAGVNVDAFVNGISTFLQRSSSLGVSGAPRFSGGLSASTKSKIAAEIQNSSVDVWTGKSDKTLRRLLIGLTVPVSGQISTLLGGLRSASIGLNLQYADLNQPQTIAPPTTVHPFTEFVSKVRAIAQQLQAGLGSALTGGGLSGSGSSGSGSGSGSGGSGASGSASSVQNYSQCIQNAGSDVTKMQQCSSLLSGK